MRDTDHHSALQGILETVPCAAVGMDEKNPCVSVHVCADVCPCMHVSQEMVK